MKKNVLAMLLALALPLGLMAGCGQSGAANPTAPAQGQTDSTADPANSGAETPAAEAKKTERAAANEIVIGVAQDFDSLDPHHMTAAGTKEVLFNVFEGLVKPTPEGDIIPAVASEVAKSEDGLTYEFTLRQGVTFHNGDPVTMADVLYSVERRRSGEDAEALLPALGVIAAAEGEGDVLRLTLSEPSNEFLAAMMTVYILPEGYAEQETAPVGTGPYKFVSRTPQESLVLERFDGYWGTKANIDKVTFRIIENVEGLVLGLQSGALDLVMHMTSTQTAQLSQADFHVEEGSMNLVQALYLNNAAAPFDNVLARRALCYAIDKQGVIDLAFDGYGIPLGTSMFPSFGKYYDESLTDYYPHDPEQAKALLAEAGYPNGFEMTITVPSNYQPHVDTAEVLKMQLEQVGVDVTILPVEWGVWLSDVYGARQFQSTITGLTSDNMTARKLLERFGTETSNNFTNYSDPDYDATLAKALAAADDAEQTELYRALERNLTENAANVYLQDMADLVAVRNGLEGLSFYPLYVLDVSPLRWAD
ncbi:MAG: ABC transporter substrate-binding protein [Oscillospiraceae bacterium]|nr:ABC transporter substrate-binding protein [Oscillospiraceae bacterium]